MPLDYIFLRTLIADSCLRIGDAYLPKKRSKISIGTLLKIRVDPLSVNGWCCIVQNKRTLGKALLPSP